MRGGGGERKGGEGLPRLKITSGYALAWTAWVENAAITSRRMHAVSAPVSCSCTYINAVQINQAPFFLSSLSQAK